MLVVIVIKVRVVDHRGGGIRWLEAMTHVLPHWCLVPDLGGTGCREAVGFRYEGVVHEGVHRAQIVNGITPFFVTASQGYVIVIDIC
jgi:hypothetical protein